MNHLVTEFEKNAGFNEYPRPQLVRDSFLNLNGKWQFELNGQNYEITVPYPPESRISGVFRNITKKDKMRYSRKFTLPDGFKKDRVLLHFGGVDTVCEVFVNGRPVGKNEGGYLPFCFDITDALEDGENELSLDVRDRPDKNHPYGKQRGKRGGMWYTDVSGIWQTVWLESVCDNYIKSIRMTPTTDSVMITVLGGCEKKEIEFDGKTHVFYGESHLLRVENAENWTPDNPKLYQFTLTSGADRVQSYFALRTVSVCGDKLLLNGKPYFFHGLLDQGYYSDGIFTPASPEGYKKDILTAKKCGFNMLRKHIKLEPDLFYYYCDKYGMAVFQDFINNGGYNFIIDTALPNLFLKRGVTHFASKKRRKMFFETSEGIMDALYNHPSVLYYTVFNEGWGQFDADGCYTRFKKYDPTRVYDTTSGWFKTRLSDVESEHIYFKRVRLKKKARPTVLSEFGGYSCCVEGHRFNTKGNLGYSKTTSDTRIFEKDIEKLYRRDVVENIKNGLVASVMTQLSDVEDETNGIMTYDRAVLKVDPSKMQALAKEIFDGFEKYQLAQGKTDGACNKR